MSARATASPLALPSGRPPEAADADAELARLAMSGHPRAPAAVWDRYHAEVHRIVWRALGASAAGDVEDLVQEVFLRVFGSFRRLRKEGSMRSYILVTTSSVVASELRRRKVRRFLGLTAAGVLPEVPVTPSDEEARQVLAKVSAALDRAPALERMAFVLKHVEGLPLPAVAAALRTSVATVKRRLARLQGRLERGVLRDEAVAAYFGVKAPSRRGGGESA